jgi:hypothetical protein
MLRTPISTTATSCRTCRHFFNASPAIESALPGLSSLSSAYAAVRAEDGVCSLHDRYIAAESVCSSHAVRVRYNAATSTRQS